MRIGTNDYLLPTMMVGNYPKPRWWTGQAFSELPVGDFLPDAISFEAFEDCLAAMVRDQEDAGLDVISDARVIGGDSPYASIVRYFVDRIDGMDPVGKPLTIPVYSTMNGFTVTGPLRRRAPMLVAQLDALKRLTDKPVKMQFPGLQVLTMVSANRYYPDVKDMAFDLARVYNEELRELVDHGADIIQFDEFTWHYGLSMGEWEVEAFNRAIDGVEAHVIAHVCWGNYAGTSGYLPDGPMHGDAPDKEGTTYVLSWRSDDAGTRRTGAIFPRVQKLNFDILNIETARKGAADLAPLTKHGWDRPVVAGVIDVKDLEIETATTVAGRIRAALEYVPAERLALSTDCGLINTPRIVASAKLRALVEGAALVREELRAGTNGDLSAVGAEVVG
jgi:5-methyltetrahydropteroyltriglutamate--homocysteine methyltransferase